MDSATRTGGFILGLVAVTGVAALVGAAVGPVGAQPGHPAEHGAGHGSGYQGLDGAAERVPGGLMVSQDGYTLRLLQDRFESAARVPLRFAITDPAGAAVTAYDSSHGKELHLIAVRRDLSGFQHVHPTRTADGTWSVPLDLRSAGDYRVFADFKPRGSEEGYTLGHDLSVAGDYDPMPLAAPTGTVSVDGYDVRLDGTLVPGRTSRLTLTVTRDGRDVTDLQPYLGAYGHLVALRDGDLAYLHVHPDGEPGDGRTASGPGITFHAEVPSPGSYRLFLDFQHEGRVRTAAFTAVATGDPTSDAVDAEADGDDAEPDHDAGGHGH